MTKRDKKLHTTNEDVDMDVEERTSEKKHKRKARLDASLEMAETGNNIAVISDPSSKKNKNKSISKLDQEDVTLQNEESQPSKKSKRKNKRKSGEESPDLEESVTIEAVESQPSKKSKKYKSKKTAVESLVAQEDVTLEAVESQQTQSPKKSKRKKKLGKESLGVVDTDILQQARVNLGLNLVDPVLLGKENVDKKKSSKEKKEKKSVVVSSNEGNDKNRNERAVEYLRLWDVDKQTWKFNKMMQVQLLHIMYDKSLMNDEDFELLLMYLDGLKGKGRERTKEDAKKILDTEETEGSGDTDKEVRARQIFQMLA